MIAKMKHTTHFLGLASWVMGIPDGKLVVKSILWLGLWFMVQVLVANVYYTRLL
jgi:hypothetical protein